MFDTGAIRSLRLPNKRRWSLKNEKNGNDDVFYRATCVLHTLATEFVMFTCVHYVRHTASITVYNRNHANFYFAGI